MFLFIFRGETGRGENAVNKGLFFGPVDLEIAYENVFLPLGLEENEGVGGDEFCRVVKVGIFFARGDDEKVPLGHEVRISFSCLRHKVTRRKAIRHTKVFPFCVVVACVIGLIVWHVACAVRQFLFM